MLRAPSEPRVLTEDVETLLRRVIRPDDPDQGEAVALVAARAETSTRTVYRVLGRESRLLNLDLADRLVMAAGEHLDLCRVELGTGLIVDYLDAC